MADFPFEQGAASVALKLDGYYVWDCSVIEAEGKFHMFSSRWERELGFGWNWLFNSEIIHSVADKPEGPYKFLRVVLPRRGRQFFDGMNTHNTCIKYFGGKYYLYYMGTTYNCDCPRHISEITQDMALSAWNNKRIGLAVADSIYGEFKRSDEPILQPREGKWDCTATTNPSVAILPDGKTYMIYKSRSGDNAPLQLGVAVADRPEGPFKRLTDGPILNFNHPDAHVEDPHIWYDEQRKKFCLIAKDDSKNGYDKITGEWGAGFYAESDDCINFALCEHPKVYSRKVRFEDGSERVQCNLERPSLLFEGGAPKYLFCATGDGDRPYFFEEPTYILAIKLAKRR